LTKQSQVALNFQKLNAAMMLNTAQFDGTGGWVLKPAGYLPAQNQHRPERFDLDLSIKLLAAQSLGVEGDTPNVYVKCELHVESQDEIEQHRIPKGGENKGGERKLRSAVRRARDPDFGGEAMDFKHVQHVFPPLSFVRYVQVIPSCLLVVAGMDFTATSLAFVNLPCHLRVARLHTYSYTYAELLRG
jgi:hypothetical protein